MVVEAELRHVGGGFHFVHLPQVCVIILQLHTYDREKRAKSSRKMGISSHQKWGIEGKGSKASREENNSSIQLDASFLSLQ